MPRARRRPGLRLAVTDDAGHDQVGVVERRAERGRQRVAELATGGANILGTNVHLWPFVMEARRNGAKLYTIDPNRNRTGAASDKHFFINPGSDTALALAMMHVIVGEGLHDADYVERYTDGFDGLRERVRAWTPQRAAELTGIAADEIVQLAREYATTRPAAIRLNYGVQRSERGATAVRTIALLPALTGSWKDVGGGLQLSTSQAFQFNRAGIGTGGSTAQRRWAAKRALSTCRCWGRRSPH